MKVARVWSVLSLLGVLREIAATRQNAGGKSDSCGVPEWR
jgi:hypothetical protein